MRRVARVYLALGTNLGDRKQNLREALTRLEPGVQTRCVSSVYETEPWGVTMQPPFLNMVVEGETELEPLALLDVLKRIEREMGREEGVRYGPRIIDLDILLYDNQTWSDERLEIPHPGLAERRFVLVPLVEIAPAVIHPRLNQTAQDLLKQIPDTGDVRLWSAWE